MKYKAALFDFDYTLADASASIYEGFCYGFERMGYPKPELEPVRRTIGLLLEDGFTVLTGEASPVKREEFRRLYKGFVEDKQAQMTVILPGARELLQALHDRGVKLGIVTSKHVDTLRKILAYHNLLDLMDFTVGGETVKLPKPDPEGLNQGIESLGVNKGEVLYCGDTTIDAGTAKNAGVDFCAVLNGTTPGSDFEAYPHIHIAPGLVELKTWLGI